jgi:putative membrane protein
MSVALLLLASLALYLCGVGRLWRNAGVGHGVTVRQTAAFAGAMCALFTALVGLHELSEQLFAAHMVQHELLMLVAAPLAAIGAPFLGWLWLLPARPRRRLMLAVRRPAVLAVTAVITAPATVWLLHGIALWTWHIPSLYEAALGSELVHVAQHLSFFTTAVLFWWGLAHGRYGRIGYGAAVVYVFATAVHSGILGALLTFSPHVWYPLYANTASAFGLTPLEDQQLAGLLMWVPASIVFIAGGLVFFAAWLRESERRAAFGFAPRQGMQRPVRLAPLAQGEPQRPQRTLISLVCVVSLASLSTTACDRETYHAAARMTGGDPARGKASIRKYGCDTCHQIPGVGSSANSHVGPPLTSVAERVYLAGRVRNSPSAMQQFIRHPREIDPRTAMPDMNVSDGDGRDIAAYLYTLR